MSINKKFAEIVDFGLYDVDELGDSIIMNNRGEPTLYTDQMPPVLLPFGYMIISSTFAFFEEEDEDDEST
tara:strand:+ start:325 stop:534 length:210 start_codon:yes stop_codon:yes gene_type:complete